MHIVLWDTHAGGAYKDFAGGFGVGQFQGKGFRARLLAGIYQRDYRSPCLAFGYLAAILRQKGHHVRYCLDRTPAADVYIFNPALMTLPHEIAVIRQLHAQAPRTRILVVGQVASTMPDAFADVPCQVLRGEAEQLLWKWDDVLACEEQHFDLGTVAHLDHLPFPDWLIFPHAKFRVTYDFWKFPTAYIQASRGCTLSCSYCPYIILENKVRARAAENVVAEMRRNMHDFGFRSFKFRDPLFGAKRQQALDIADLIRKLPKKIQFSVESRIELLTRDLLVELRDAGLTSVTVGIETPSRDTLVKYHRAPIKDDKQEHFVEMCRELGVRVVAGFMIGFPEDTRETIRGVLRYAKHVGPFAANFNVCTPYPGTGFYEEIRPQIANQDWSRYNVYTPNLKYEHLTTDEVQDLHTKCFTQYYFRWKYLQENWRFLFPRMAHVTDTVRELPTRARTWLRTATTITPVTPAVTGRPGELPTNVPGTLRLLHEGGPVPFAPKPHASQAGGLVQISGSPVSRERSRGDGERYFE